MGVLHVVPLLALLAPPSEPPSKGMAWIPGGTFHMGHGVRAETAYRSSDMRDMSDSRPVHKVKIKGFWMDRTEVTNAQFAQFVKATKYVTIAERKPRAEDFPGAPPENLVAGSIVFSPPRNADVKGSSYQWWSYVRGANWKYPEGPGSNLRGRENHPVVHIAWADAVAYAKWARKRLPTEAEWEYAARGKMDRKPYTWGDQFRPNGKYMANTFQGTFPTRNTKADGFMATAPVKSFSANGYGLYDMAGNVWEWCSDWYRADTFESRASSGLVSNPKGPSNSHDPAEPGISKRVLKGGSFLCTDQYCSRYMPGGRGKSEPSSSTNHIGFRLVADGPSR